MRWLVLGLALPCMAAAKEVEIPCTPWHEGHLMTCDAVLVAEVLRTDAAVVHAPGEAWLKDACVLRLQDVIGNAPELLEADTIRLSSEQSHDQYQQVDPAWGRYRHLPAGQQVLVLVHHYENDLALGDDAVIPLSAATRTLPDILRRTQLDLALLTEADLAVWKAASPRMFPELAARVAYEREQLQAESRMGKAAPRGGWAVVGVLLVLGGGLWFVREARSGRKRRE